MNKNLVFPILLLIIASCNLQTSRKVKQLKEVGRKSGYDQKLANQLSEIYESDQNIRIQLMDSINKYWIPSPQTDPLCAKMRISDSLNLIKTKHILDTKGWLGAETVGNKGNSALFLVIQHSNLKTMEYYLPMLREAVKNKKADSRDLAKMEDRVLVWHNKKQLYGTQFNMDSVTHKYILDPLDDPDNVDKRRAKMGMGKLADALLEWGIKWDLEGYKKEFAVKNK